MNWLSGKFKPIENILGYIIEFFYRWIPSYGIGIILLTITVWASFIAFDNKPNKGDGKNADAAAGA